MADYVPVLRTAELGPGEMREVAAHGEMLVLVNVGQTYYALSARCRNDGVNLAREGRLQGDLLVCPHDGWSYELATGRRVDPSPGPGLERYAIRVEENEIRIGPPFRERRAGAA